MQDKIVTIMGVGDINIDREKPESIFSHVKEILGSADIVFAQLEQVFSDKTTRNPLASYRNRSDPGNISALNFAGFDVVSLAGNHSCDWGTDALLDSVERLRKAGIAVIGVGSNIAEARRPALLERKGIRMAFLSYCSTGPAGYEADERWPGFAPVRVWTHYEQIDYQPGTPPQILTFPYDEDLTSMVEDIRQAKAQADIVILFMHWGVHHIPGVIPMYEFKVAHAAIDAGADLILGGHPHILKGIEVYRGKVIFHSLGNFANDSAKGILKEEYHYDIRKPFVEQTRKLYDRGLPEAKLNIIAKAIISQSKVEKVSFLPCYINPKREPQIVLRQDPRSQEVVDYVEEISRSQGLETKFSREGDEVVVLT